MASQTSTPLTGRTKSHIYAIIGALLAFALSVAVPAVAITTMKLLPTEATITQSSAPTNSTVYDSSSNCDEQGPRSCFVIDTQTQQLRTVTLTEAESDENVQVHAKTQILTTAGHDLLKADDRLTLIRNSTYPVTDAVSALTVTAPSFALNFDTGEFTRDGIQYFLPFETEKRSYDYFDAVAQKTSPLDFVNQRGDEYEFTQQIPPENLLDAATRSYTHPTDITDEFTGEALQSDLTDEQRETLRALMVDGSATQFYPTGTDLTGATVTGAVVLKPYYQASRTLYVDQHSGTILNQDEEIFIFLARTDEEAAATATALTDDPSLIQQDTDLRARTLLHSHYQWDEATQQAAREHAEPTAQSLTMLRVFAFLCQLIGLGLLIFGLWRYNSIRKG